MVEEELVQAFESGALEAFPHESHVRVAWCYLRRHPLLVALAKFRAALQQFAAGKGRADRYHETITIGLMLLIADRHGDIGESWEEFARRNPDLLQWPCPTLMTLYAAEMLDSARAREVFVLPEVSNI